MELRFLCFALMAAASASARSFGQSQLMRKLQRNAVLQINSNDPTPQYQAHTLAVPVDHFHNDSRYAPHSNESFELRYWFDATYYKPGGPVLVLCSGESSGEERLPFLQKGIIYELAKATNGLGVVLEHRYYGESLPATNGTVIESLRFLTTDQSMADTAYFASHIKFPGLEQHNLTANYTPWIAYGGSYAGAYVAIMRTLYPDVFWGAISSSGVSHAQWDYWEYMNAAAEYAPLDYVNKTRVLTHVIDNILIHNTSYAQELKALWNLTVIPEDARFMDIVGFGISGLQYLNWDPALNFPQIYDYFSNLSSATIRFEGYEAKQASTEKLIAAGGYANEAKSLTPHLLNWVSWYSEGVLKPAQIGGEWDPWRAVTPLADDFLNEPSTMSQPRILIPKAVHHWDENGIFPNETTPYIPPTSIKEVQSKEVEFVQSWLDEYRNQRSLM